MRISNIWSRDNLLLAWRRLTTGRNLAYKRYFRKLYYAYEIALHANLRDLQQRLKAGSFKPQQPTRIYLPKASGLQRPITLLFLEDQIVLQSIANLFAEKVRSRRRKLEHKCVFSNILQAKQKSIFFLQDWRLSYSMFQTTIKKDFDADFRWIAHFDLAAYYDTICHHTLLKTVFPRSGDTNLERILQFLKTWSSQEISSSHSHGIPQGPIASDFLAECFLLPFDEALQKERIRFVRYVDDIRLFAKSQNALREAAIRMEIVLRERGLIPEGKKHGITYAQTPEDAMGILPSIEPRAEGAESQEDLFTADEAAEKFRSALSGRPLTISDKTRVRFVLFHASPSPYLTKYVLLLMPRHPEHIDVFAHYLAQLKRSRRIIRECLELARESPYEFVRGEMWHLLAKMMRPHEIRPHINKAVNIAKDRRIGLALKWGALNFLCVAESAGLGKYGRFIMYQDNALLLALLAPILPDARYVKDDVAEKILRKSAFEPGLAIADQLVRLKLKIESFGIQSHSLPSQVRNTFYALGLISSRSSSVDPMGEILSRRYGIQEWGGWKSLLGSEYSHALQLLGISEATFDIGRSQWLSYQNSFNHILFLSFQKWLRRKRLPGTVKVIGKDGNAVKFGLLVNPNQPFAGAYPVIARGFAKTNSRRNTLPASHPYELSSGKKTRHLKKVEQKGIVVELAKSYTEIIAVVTGKP